MNAARSSRPRGFSLLEVLIALVVLSIGLLGVAAMQASALSSTGGSQVESMVVMEAKSLADAMVANSAYWASGTQPPVVTIAAPTSGTTPVITGLSASSTDCTASACTASQVAGYDVQNWGKQLLTQVPGAGASVKCVAGAPVACTIVITWSQKSAAAVNSGTGNATASTSQSYTLVNQI
ncbi:type IV pilus modification protein PilV [Dyella choica]|uniref:Type IV pilus modification protein PilV n=1 Tax=Dyella choica TaxID=1927959 RepID=A0A3S0PHN0_9GAMM|nr:type IV pilus modification protein PilV [Dyella choica]RUL74044.1 type IV pilus modification protein PilV [Dyella choica]